jgi:hypothetical protein
MIMMHGHTVKIKSAYRNYEFKIVFRKLYMLLLEGERILRHSSLWTTVPQHH